MALGRVCFSPDPRANRINPLVNVSTCYGQLAREDFGAAGMRRTVYCTSTWIVVELYVQYMHAKCMGCQKVLSPVPPLRSSAWAAHRRDCGSWQQKSLES